MLLPPPTCLISGSVCWVQPRTTVCSRSWMAWFPLLTRSIAPATSLDTKPMTLHSLTGVLVDVLYSQV